MRPKVILQLLFRMTLGRDTQDVVSEADVHGPCRVETGQVRTE